MIAWLVILAEEDLGTTPPLFFHIDSFQVIIKALFPHFAISEKRKQAPCFK